MLSKAQAPNVGPTILLQTGIDLMLNSNDLHESAMLLVGLQKLSILLYSIGTAADGLPSAPE
jgi:hypothetical protein